MSKSVTKNSSYRLIKTSASDETAISTYYIGALDASNATVDLITTGDVSEANELEFVIAGTASDNATFDVYVNASNDSGPEVRVCKLACTLGTAVTASGGSTKWVDTAVATSYHLASGGIVVADSGNNTVCKIGFDAIGYRYLRVYVNNRSEAAHNVFVYIRHL
jgi:hypothetical protein